MIPDCSSMFYFLGGSTHI
uniref:Uncharacterized protein n=1 Tax=Arundo donax TaxID=35708 RepID=A0A0A8Z6D4_ARUDO